MSGSVRPAIDVTESLRRVVRNESVKVGAAILHEVGLTSVMVSRNGEVVGHEAFDTPARSYLLDQAVPLAEGDNVIRIIARAGRDERTTMLRTRYRPYLIPPRIEILSSRPVTVDSSVYVLQAAVTDSNGLERVMVYNNSRLVERFDVRRKRTTMTIDLGIPLDEGTNTIIVFAANREESRYEQFEIVCRRKREPVEEE